MAEQSIEELQAQLEQVRKAQSGSDRRVQELSEENAALKQKLEETSTKGAETVSKRQQELDRKERVLSLAVEKGIKPEDAFTLLGLDGSDDEDRLDAYTKSLDAKKAEAADEFAKKHGRKIQHAQLGRKTSYEELLRMPDRQIDKMSDAEFTGAINQGLAESRSRNRQTRRSQILADLGRV